MCGTVLQHLTYFVDFVGVDFVGIDFVVPPLRIWVWVRVLYRRVRVMMTLLPQGLQLGFE